MCPPIPLTQRTGHESSCWFPVPRAVRGPATRARFGEWGTLSVPTRTKHSSLAKLPLLAQRWDAMAEVEERSGLGAAPDAGKPPARENGDRNKLTPKTRDPPASPECRQPLGERRGIPLTLLWAMKPRTAGPTTPARLSLSCHCCPEL